MPVPFCTGLLVVVAGFCSGMTCTVTGPTTGWPWTTQTPLDRADAVIRIEQSTNDAEAVVTATISDRFGLTLELGDDQAVRINGLDLAGPDQAGQYTAYVVATDEYTITVQEPTRGVLDTTITAPASFEITAPAEGGSASLAGFTLSWSQADESLEVEVRLSQSFAGTQETETFGPFVDSGSVALDAADLRDFVQGADLLITVTKVARLGSVAGFRSATAAAYVSATRTASPRP